MQRSRWILSQPGMHCDSRAVLKRLCQTKLREAKSNRSPARSMVWFFGAQAALFLSRSRASSVAFTMPE
jgi:hypothetical protein